MALCVAGVVDWLANCDNDLDNDLIAWFVNFLYSKNVLQCKNYLSAGSTQ